MEGRRQALGDAALYGVSALFAVATAMAGQIAVFREWGRVAAWAYGAGALAALGVAAGSRRRPGWARTAVAAAVLTGALFLPFVSAVAARASGPGWSHVQSETVVTEEAARLLGLFRPYAKGCTQRSSARGGRP